MINNRRSRNDLYAKPVECIPQEMYIDNVRLAAGYVPFQQMCELFNPIEALSKGTAFPELYSPYDKKDKRMRSNKLCEKNY